MIKTKIGRSNLSSKCAACCSKKSRFMNTKLKTKALKDKAFEIANNPKYDGYQRGLASMVDKLFDEKPKGAGFSISFLVRNQKELVLNLCQINS